MLKNVFIIREVEEPGDHWAPIHGLMFKRAYPRIYAMLEDQYPKLMPLDKKGQFYVANPKDDSRFLWVPNGGDMYDAYDYEEMHDQAKGEGQWFGPDDQTEFAGMD
jgi:hypothetical protein